MKIHPVGAEFFHADGRTNRHRADITKLIVAFRNYAKASEDEIRNLRNCILSAQTTIFRPILDFNVT